MSTPTFAHGKICYVMLPCDDPTRLTEFYKQIFGWNIRDGVAFDDSVGEVSGRFMAGLAPATEPGVDLHIMVDDLYATIANIESAGGQLVKDFTGEPASGGERWAWFTDPYGNRLGIYEQR